MAPEYPAPQRHPSGALPSWTTPVTEPATWEHVTTLQLPVKKGEEVTGKILHQGSPEFAAPQVQPVGQLKPALHTQPLDTLLPVALVGQSTRSHSSLPVPPPEKPGKHAQ